MLSSQEWVCSMKFFSPSVSRLSFSPSVSRLSFSPSVSRLSCSPSVSRLSFSPSVSRLSCSTEIEQINGKTVCLTDYIIRLILYTVHIIHQKDNINMDCREMECENVNWIQLMQPRSVVNTVLNISVAWEHKTIRLHVLCQRIMETEGISIVPNLCVWSLEKLYHF
jgi:hypothetical protein